MEISAIISKVNFYNKDNGYSVLLVTLEKNQFQILKKKSHLIGNKLIVVGNLDRVPLVDEEYTFIGDFVKDANYGLQFKFNEFKRATLENAEGLIKSVSEEFILSDSGELSINQIEKSKVVGLEDALANIEGLHGLQINSQDLIVSENKKINIMFDEKNFTYANNVVSLKPMTLSDLVNPEEGEEEIVLNGGNA